MEDEPEVVFEAEADAFAEAAELLDFFSGGGAEGRRGSAKEKRANDTDRLEGLAENAFFEGFDIDDDVGEFRQCVLQSWMPQLGTESIVQRLGTLVARAAQMEWWFAGERTQWVVEAGEKSARTGRRDSENYS